MEQSFFEKLKMVKISDMLHIFKFLLAFPIALIYKLFRKNMWLITDTGSEARDNGYHFYRYLRRKHREVDAVYAIDYFSPDFNLVKRYGETVNFGSLKHWIYYLAAEVNISSQKYGKPNAALCYILEVYGIIKNKRVFLQHGIIASELGFLFYENTKMSMFVTSTEREYNYVKDNYHYPDGIVKKCGLARYDRLYNYMKKNSVKGNKKEILIMPTWRMYIRNSIMNKDNKSAKKAFLKTDYYKAWNSLINNDRFIEYIEANDIKVKFHIHRELMRWEDLFKSGSRNIEFVKWPKADVQNLLMEAGILITDFSSVAMDFGFMEKPVIYYQFDEKKFRAEHHKEGYFDFRKDGFGPVFENETDTIDYVIGLISKDNISIDKEMYRERSRNFFGVKDNKNCERTYNEIKGIL